MERGEAVGSGSGWGYGRVAWARFWVFECLVGGSSPPVPTVRDASSSLFDGRISVFALFAHVLVWFLWCCSLPGVPVEPKLLPFPFDTEQPFEYNVRRCPTLEETYAYGLHTEIDVGVPINLVDPAVYEPPKAGAPLHDLDKYITNPSFGTAVSLKRLPGLVLFAVARAAVARAAVRYHWLLLAA